MRADSLGVDGRGYLLLDTRLTTSDAAGHYQLTGLPRGHGQLYAYGKSYLLLDVLKLRSIPSENLTLHMTAAGAIKGRVLSKFGKPATHGNVNIEPPGEKIGKWGASGDTKADGSFAFDNVPLGQYIVTAMATNPGPALRGKDPNAKTITVKPGETTRVDVTGR